MPGMAKMPTRRCWWAFGPEDFGSEHPLAGIEFQRRIEQAAFRAAGGFRAISQKVGDLLQGRETKVLGVVRPPICRAWCRATCAAACRILY